MTIAAGLVLTLAHAALAFRFDIPAPTGFVVDRVGVLDAATQKRLVDLNRELAAKTGAEIAIVVVDSTQPEPPFDYAMAIAERWKPGSAEKDNGVVFLVATGDRQMYILTGYGAEGALPDGLVGEIRDRIARPAFRRGDYAAGILQASTEMAARLATDAGVSLDGAPPPRSGRRRRSGGLIGVLFLLVAYVFLQTLLGRGGRRRRRGRHGDAWGTFVPGNVFGGGFGRGGFGGPRPGGFGRGGFGGGGFGGGGFGGFGGGGFGGGGAGGSW